MTPIVEMRGIRKSFGPVRALWDVSLYLMPGEILGLVGDNSAGKSTLSRDSTVLASAYMRGLWTKSPSRLGQRPRKMFWPISMFPHSAKS